MFKKLTIIFLVLTLFLTSVSFGLERSSKYVDVKGSDMDEVTEECDNIIERLNQRYGKPKTWKRFPVRFSVGGGNVAGYTSYAGVVNEVVVFQSFDVARGGTLDHELTHAYFFYLLEKNFPLLLSEGVAQNSEYRRRKSLRQTVHRRYTNNEFVSLSSLFKRNGYDGGLLIYHEGFSLVDFLIAKGGSRWFAMFLNDYSNKTKNINASLKRFYDYNDIEELESDWIEYIKDGQDRRSVKSVI